jgi:hypothetical protein
VENRKEESNAETPRALRFAEEAFCHRGHRGNGEEGEWRVISGKKKQKRIVLFVRDDNFRAEEDAVGGRSKVRPLHRGNSKPHP